MRLVSARDPGWQPGCPTARQLVASRVPTGLPEAPESGGISASSRAEFQQFKHWTEDAQERALEILRQRELNPRRPFFCPRLDCDGEPHDNWDWRHARADQRMPPLSEEWLTWVMSGGRGSGKTRAGAETIHKAAKRFPRINLVAPTGPDLRDTMVEGISGLLATAPADFIPEWEPSKKRLTWPNGAVAIGYSGEEPDRLRGPQCYWAWLDEPAHMPLIEAVWDNLLLGLRLGDSPRIIATTTPKSTKWMKSLVKDPDTRVSRVSTYANLPNLSGTFKKKVLARYEGTRLGRQELHGEVLEDIEGALWSAEWFQYVTPDEVPVSFDRILVAIDPAGSKNKRSDETGIIVLGVVGKVIYILADLTDKYTPSGWANAAVAAYHRWSADALVAEYNYGGDMVREVLEKNGAKDIKIVTVHSRRGKAIRAEPIAALYEKGAQPDKPTRVYHITGATGELEDELSTWVPGVGDSPNRLDALVHGVTEIAKISFPAEIASPLDIKEELPRPRTVHRMTSPIQGKSRVWG